MSIKEGDPILLYLTERKRWLVKVIKDSTMHTHKGFIELNNALDKEYGEGIKSSLGTTFWLLKPTMEDYVMKSARKTQIVYPKDMGIIAAKSGINSGSIVIESGTGSGVLTGFIANLVKPSGHVYSYEIREEFIEIAKKNLKRCGVLDFVTIKHCDVKEGMDVSNADLGIVDVGDPWSVIKTFRDSLKGSGMIVIICPTMNQVEKSVIELNEQGFISIETIEVITRNIESRIGITRPTNRMVGHTAYLVFGKKIIYSDKD